MEVKDAEGTRYSCLNILCLGPPYQQVVLLHEGGSQASSQAYLDAFVERWANWAGWPKFVTTDRGAHNSGIFSRTLAQNSVLIRQAGVESPEQIGRVERHGGLWKHVLRRVVVDHGVTGMRDMRMAMSEATSAKNALARNGGFSPSQWVFGCLPRGPRDQGDEQEFADLGVLGHGVRQTGSVANCGAPGVREAG